MPNYDDILNQYAKQRELTAAPTPMDTTDKYGSILDNMANQRDQKFAISVGNAVKGSPERAAEAQRIAKELNLSPTAVEANFDNALVTYKQRMLDKQRAAQDDPILAMQFTNPDFAKIAHDDWWNLSTAGKVMRWFREIPEDAAKGFKAGVLQYEQGKLAAQEMQAGVVMPDVRKRLKAMDAEMKGLKGTGGFVEETLKVIGQMSQSVPAAAEFGAAAGITAGGVGLAMGPGAPVAAPAAALTAFGAGFTAKMAEEMYGVEGGSAYKEMIDEGVSLDTARYVGAGVGVVNSLLEVTGMQFVAAPFKKALIKETTQQIAESLAKPTMRAAVTEFGKNYGKAVAGEVTTELLQEMTAIVGADIASLYDKPAYQSKFLTEEGRTEIVSRLGDVFESTIKAMAVLGAPGAAVNFRSDYKLAKEAERQTQFFESLGAAAESSKLRERSPDAFHNLISQQAAANGVENVYVDGERFAQSMIDAGVTVDQLRQVLPGVVDQISEAVRIGEDIVIPTADYATYVAGTKFGQSLLPHVRADINAISAAEAVEFENQKKALLDAAVAKVEEKKAADKVFAESATKVQQQFEQQIAGATTIYTPQQLKREAMLMSRMYEVMAERMGILPEQAYEMYPITVGAEGQLNAQTLNQTEINNPQNLTAQQVLTEAGRLTASILPNSVVDLGTADGTWAGSDTLNIDSDGNVVLVRRADNVDHLGKGWNAVTLQELFDTSEHSGGGRGLPTSGRANWLDSFGVSRPDTVVGTFKIPVKDFLRLIEEGNAIIGNLGEGEIVLNPAIAEQYLSEIDGQPVGPQVDEGTLKQAMADDRMWRNWEPEVTSTGKIKGAPEWVNNKDDLARMRRDLRKFVREGLVGRYWYENSAQAVMDMVGGDVVLAEKFIQLLAIYSPNSNVWVNTIQAVRAFTHWRLGRSEETLDVGSGDADGKAVSVLYRNEEWDGRKTNSFYLNLMHDIVEKYPEEVSKLNLDPAFVTDLAKPATIDVWMARAFGYEVEQFSDDKGTGKYSFAENEVRRITARLNADLAPGEPRWTPHQVQAAIWTAMKTRYEFQDVKEKTNEKSLQDGLIYRDEQGKMVYPKKPEDRRKHLANWRSFAMQKTTAQVVSSAEENSRSFGDDLQRMTEVVTWEANPSTSLGLEINGASPAVLRMFTAEARQLLMDNQGNDMLAAMLGVAMSYSTEGFGAYAGGVSPNNLAHLLPMRQKGADGFSVDEVRAYTLAIQYIFKQDAVPWFRPDNKPLTAASAIDAQKFRVINKKSGRVVQGGKFETQAEADAFAASKGDGFEVRGGELSRAVVLRFNSAADSGILDEVLSTLQGYLGEDAGYTRTAENEITIINFRDDETKIPFARTDEEFIDALAEMMEKDGARLGITEQKALWTQGEYGYVHDWSQDSEGQQILNTGGLGGRSDLHTWLRGRRAAFDELIQKYSGQNLADAEQAARESGVLRQSGTGARGRLRTSDLGEIRSRYGSPRDGSTSVVGVRYSRSIRSSLSGAFYGQGLKGAEAARLSNADSRLRSRIHFYVDEGQGIQPEAGLGGYVNAIHLDNLYNTDVDPMGIVADAKAAGGADWFNRVEAAIIDQGYDGVYVPAAQGNQGVAVLLGPQHNAVQVDQKGTHAMPAAGMYQGQATGQRRYSMLSDEITQFEAQQADIEAAAPSVKYRGGNLVFDEADLEAVAQFFPGAATAAQLRQATGGQDRGGFNPRDLSITLTKDADYSTLHHETMHAIIEIYARIASSPNAPATIAEDFQKLMDFVGVADVNAWNAMSLEEQRPFHEALASAHELWFFEGKAPSVELQPVFDRISAWMRKIYNYIATNINDLYKANYGRDLPILNDEVRSVFARMYASEEQVSQAEQVRNMMPMFQTQEESGMDDATWQAYQELYQEAHDAAVTDLTKASLRNMRWLSNARSRILKELQKAADAQRKEVRAEVAAEVENEPVYLAMKFLKRGQVTAPDGTQIEAAAGHKLSIEAVKALYPESKETLTPAPDINKLGHGKYGMLAKEGLAPDLVAEMFGFPSGDALVRSLIDAKPINEEIQARTDARMEAEYGDMTDEREIQLKVEEALHNEARARFVAAELRFLNKSTQPVRVMMQAARQAARDILAGKPIKEIRPRDYSLAEARAAKQTEKHMKKGEAALAAKSKQNQLVQNQLAAEAIKARQEVEKGVESFRKFFKSDEKMAKNRNMDLVDAARSILAYYGLGQKGKAPTEYIEKLRTYNPDLYAELEPLIIDAATGSKDYTQLTLTEFRLMKEAVETLWFQSKREKEVMIEGNAIALEQVTGELNARLAAIGIPLQVAGERAAPSKKDRAIRAFYEAKAATRRVEHWANATDGAKGVGPFTTYIWRPIRQALDAYRAARNVYTKRYVESIAKLYLPVAKIEAPELGYTFGNGNGGIGKAELLGAMLHTGNESNYRKLLLGRGWAVELEDGTLDDSKWRRFVNAAIDKGVLTKADFDWLQSVWDLNEELKPMAQKAHHDLYGYYFKEVPATQVVNQLGVWRGGYVPAKTDPFIVRDAQKQAKMEELESDFRNAMPSTGMGFTKARVEYNKPLSLDIRVMAKHIDDVIRFVHVQPAVKDVLKILRNREFADNISRQDPSVIEDMLLPWLNRAARQITSEPGKHKAIDSFWRTVRSRTGISIMFANITNALQQFTGLFPAALKVNGRYLRSALGSYVTSPTQMAEQVAELSPFMADRLQNQMIEIQDMMNDLVLNPSKFDKVQKWASHHGYFLQSAFQNMVDTVTWMGAYNQTLAELGADVSDEQATREATQRADAAVRATQSSLAAEDIAAFEVGTPFYRTFIQFSGYFNTMANLNADEYVKVFRDMGWRGNKGKLAMIYVLGFMMPMILSDAIVRTLGGQWDDEDDDGYLDEFMEWFFGSQIRGAVAMVPGFGPGVAAVMNAFNDKPYDDRMATSPAVSALEGATVGVVKAGMNLVDESKQVTGKNVRDVLTLLSLVTGIPLTVLGRPIGYEMEVQRGKITPTDTADYVRGLVTGKASEASRP